MRVYISCHHPDPANELARVLAAAGHTVASEWHTDSGPRLASGDAAGWAQKAARNCELIEGAGALVVIASPEHMARTKCVPGGKFFEAGYAHVLRLQVLTVGGAENGMMHAPGIRHAHDAEELVAMLA